MAVIKLIVKIFTGIQMEVSLLYIKLLPLEIQHYIMYLVPQFTRLSKTYVTGKKYILNKSFSDITQKEINHYLLNHNIDTFYIYSYNINFYIDIYFDNSCNSYEDYLANWMGFKRFDKNIVCFQLLEDNVRRNRDQTAKAIKVGDIITSGDIFYVDLFMAYQIKDNLNECHQMTYDFNKKFLINYLNNAVNNMSNYPTPLDLIAKYYYVLHSYNKFYRYFVNNKIYDFDSLFSDMVLEEIIDLTSEDYAKKIEELNKLYNIIYKKLCNIINTFV